MQINNSWSQAFWDLFFCVFLKHESHQQMLIVNSKQKMHSCSKILSNVVLPERGTWQHGRRSRLQPQTYKLPGWSTHSSSAPGWNEICRKQKGKKRLQWTRPDKYIKGKCDHTAIYNTLTHIWENLKRASMLMLRSNTFMMAPGI